MIECTAEELAMLVLPAGPGWIRDCSPLRLKLGVCGDMGEGRGVMLDVRVREAAVIHDDDMSECDEFDEESLALDLTEATGRDHFDRWLAERCLKNYDPRGSLSFHYAGALGGWMLVNQQPFLRMNEPRSQSTAFCPQPDFEAWGEYPELVEVTYDPRILPDGSRWADAEARRLIGLHVAAGGK